MMVAMLTAFVLSLIIVLLRGGDITVAPVQLPGIIWRGVFSMALANLSWVPALSCGNTAKVSNLAYIVPFLSLAWTFFILKEPIDPISVVGLCMIVVGITVQLMGPKTLKANTHS